MIEFVEHLLDCVPVEIVIPVLPDLGLWNLDMYYEAMGLDNISEIREEDSD